MILTACHSVTVSAAARLHMGFLDLNGGLGRRYGSLGLALEELATTVTVRADETVTAEGPQSERAEAFARAALRALDIRCGVRVSIRQAVPEHAGLGSGTQLALAVGAAIARLFNLAWTPREIAGALGRGGRSGIGLGAFEHGGFVVDGGRGRQDAPPLPIARLAFPAHWRLVLIFDPNHVGLHGETEKQAFAALPAFPEAQAAHLCRLALMQALPALTEADIAGFGAAVSEIQRTVGDHFAPAQGGRFASPRVARALDWLDANGAAGVGQSSWGPTGFALVDSDERAHALARRARIDLADEGLEFGVCRGRNQAAEIRAETAAARLAAV